MAGRPRRAPGNRFFGRGTAEDNAALARYGIVLLLLFATFVVLASGFTSSWLYVVTVTLLGTTLLTVVAATGMSRRVRHITRVLVALCVIGAIVAVPFSGDAPRAGALVLNALLVAIAPIAIVVSVVRRRVIDLQTILGALCIYVLIGLLAAFVFGTIGTMDSRFFVQQASATTADYVYFSFVTLSTVGYGDLTAAGSVGRAFAVLEALLGQIYLVTVVAMLVSNFGARRTAAVLDDEVDAGDDTPRG